MTDGFFFFMTFRFNFSLEEGATDAPAVKESNAENTAEINADICQLPAQEFMPELVRVPAHPTHTQNALVQFECVPIIGGQPAQDTAALSLLRRTVDDILYDMALDDGLQSDDSPAASAMRQQSDRVCGVYEGGLKTWECSLDLVAHLSSMRSDLGGKRVLELGCGSALPGIFCLLSGASAVHFQDYNAEVLEFVTAPNVLINLEQSKSDSDPNSAEMQVNWTRELSATVRLFSGGWESMQSLLGEQSYDLILTSETIYQPESHHALLHLMQHSLALDGTVLVASKSYYFGVGGGVDVFLSKIDRCGLTCTDRHRVQDGKSAVLREILTIKRKK